VTNCQPQHERYFRRPIKVGTPAGFGCIEKQARDESISWRPCLAPVALDRTGYANTLCSLESAASRARSMHLSQRSKYCTRPPQSHTCWMHPFRSAIVLGDDKTRSIRKGKTLRDTMVMAPLAFEVRRISYESSQSDSWRYRRIPRLIFSNEFLAPSSPALSNKKEASGVLGAQARIRWNASVTHLCGIVAYNTAFQDFKLAFTKGTCVGLSPT
jgi:hypothetical protein